MSKVISNISGTSNQSFSIGKNGVTFYQGPTSPEGAKAGDFWFNTTNGQVRCFLSQEWSLITAQAPAGSITSVFGRTGAVVAQTGDYTFSQISNTPTTLSGYGITDAQPLDADLTAIAGISATSGLLRKTAANTWSLDTNTYLTSFTETDPVFSASAAAGITTTNISNWNTAFGWGDHAAAGYLLASTAATTYQPVDTELTALASVTSAANALPYFTGSGTATTTTLSAFGRQLIDDADAATARTTLGATTVGGNLFTLANPSAIRFIRVNADNTVSALDAATFRTAIGAGTSNTTGTVTSVSGTGTVSGLTLSGTVTTTGNITLGGTLAVTPSNFASQTANTFLAAPNGTAGAPTFRAIVAADIPTLNQNTTGSAATLTTTRTLWGQNFNGSANVTGSLSSVTTISMSSQLINTVATGTAPFVISSTTRVSNLNVATAGTADTWTTARNLTIGSTAKSVDGSTNVSWTLGEIGAQAALVSGTNIKTVNGNSLLGSGDLTISAPAFNGVLSGNNPFFELDNTRLGTGDWRIRNGVTSNSALDFFKVGTTTPVLTLFDSQAAVNSATVPTETTLFVRSHSSTQGAHIDVRTSNNFGSSIIDIQSPNYDTNFSSILMLYTPDPGFSLGTFLGQDIRNSGQLQSAGSALTKMLIGSVEEVPVIFGNSNVEVFRIHTNQNVGIGATAPAYKLDVNGEVNATGLRINGVAIVSVTSTDISNWNTAFGWGNHATAGYLLASTAATTYQPVDADLTAIAGLSGTTGLLRKTAANTWSLDTTTYAADSEVVKLTGNQTIAGNKTLTGQTSLVNGTTAGANTQISISPADGALGRESQIVFGATFASGWGGGDTVARLSGAIRYGDAGGTNPRDLAMKFFTSTTSTDTLTERMRITTEGNVGIGKTNPVYMVDVNGEVNATGLRINGTSIQSLPVSAAGTSDGQLQLRSSTGTLTAVSGLFYSAGFLTVPGSMSVGTSISTTYLNANADPFAGIPHVRLSDTSNLTIVGLTALGNALQIQSFNSPNWDLLCTIDATGVYVGPSADKLLTAADLPGALAPVDYWIENPMVSTITTQRSMNISAINQGFFSDSTTNTLPGGIVVNSTVNLANGGASFATNPVFYTGVIPHAYEILFRTPVPGSLAALDARLGLMDNTTSTSANWGVYFRITGSNIRPVTVTSAAVFTNGSNYALSANTVYKARIVLNAAGTSAVFTVFSSTGTVLNTQTISTTMPATSSSMRIGGIVWCASAASHALINISSIGYGTESGLARARG